MGVRQSTTKNRSSPYETFHEDWPYVWAIRDAECLDWRVGLSDDEIQAKAMQQRDLPVPITDSVYLGNAASVESASELKERGITAVLNMAGGPVLHPQMMAYKKHGIQYKAINAEDEEDYNLLEKDWEEAYEFIKATTKDGKGKCAVHCVAGMNRSGLVVAAYYMIEADTTVLEAVKHVRNQRGNVALSNGGFQQQLVAMARINNLLGAEPGTDGSIVKQAPPPADSDCVFAAATQPKHNPLDRLVNQSP